MRKTKICRTRTLIAVRISDRGATKPSTIGRTTALSSAITTTTAAPDAEPVDRDARQQLRRQPEGDCRHDERDHESLDERPRPALPLPQDAELGLVELNEVAHRMNVETAIGRVILRLWAMPRDRQAARLITVDADVVSASLPRGATYQDDHARGRALTHHRASSTAIRGARWHRVLRPVPDLRLAARREATGWPFRSGTRGVVPTHGEDRRSPSRSSMWRRSRESRSCGSSPSSETVSVFVRIGFYRPYSWAAVSCSWRCSGPPVERSPAWSRAIGSRERRRSRRARSRHSGLSRSPSSSCSALERPRCS